MSASVAIRKVDIIDGQFRKLKFEEPPILPRKWRGLTITTRYFAAIDFEDVKDLPTNNPPKNSATKIEQTTDRKNIDYRGMLDALRFYHIGSGGSDLRDK
jgi:hypothetical protein